MFSCGFASGAPLEEVRGERDVPLVGEVVGELAHPVLKAVPFVDDDQGGEGAVAIGDGHVAGGERVAVDVAVVPALECAAVRRRWRGGDPGWERRRLVSVGVLCGRLLPRRGVGAGGQRGGLRRSAVAGRRLISVFSNPE